MVNLDNSGSFQQFVLLTTSFVISYTRLSRIKYKEEARKLLFKYAEAAKKMIDSR